jgi:hypothetical protein
LATTLLKVEQLKKTFMIKKLLITSFLVGGMLLSAKAGSVVVPGTADPWLAGMPAGSLDNLGTPEPPDVAPFQSPVLAGFVSGGDMLTWQASGQVGHPEDISGPDGAAGGVTSRFIGANNGMSDIASPICALLGVFLGPGQPDLNPAPGMLDFSTQAAQDYVTLSPALQQVFFMGDGLTSGSVPQTLIAPAGATRLFLGVMDGYGWANNIGEFDVNIQGVPDSSQYCWLALLGVVLASAIHRRCVPGTA